MGTVRGDLLFFSPGKLFQIRPHTSETQLSIEPEGARSQSFFVILADLVGVNGDAQGAESLPQDPEHLRIDPCSFAIAVGIEGVESNFDPFEERDGLDVVDWDSVLQREPSLVGAQRKPLCGRQSPHENLDAAAHIELNNVVWISSCRSV